MERFLEQQRLELLQQGAQDSGNENWDEPRWTEELENYLDVEEDDSFENENLTFITSVLDSLSNTKSGAPRLNRAGYKIITPEGVTARAQAEHMMQHKFNQKFNQNSTIKSSAPYPFSCFPTILEERSSELSDYLDEEEDDSLENEDTLSESDEEEFKFENHSEVDTKEAKDEPTFTGIFCISEEKGQAFSAW
jgi:hypothetical protein